MILPHTHVLALIFLYLDSQYYVADPDVQDVPVVELLNKVRIISLTIKMLGKIWLR